MKRLVVALALLIGCGPDEPCGPRTGTFRVASRERSGTCGPVPETIVSFDDEGGRSECTYRRQGDVTSCRVEQDFTCPIVGFPGQTVTSRGVITWAAGGRSASGTMSMEIRDGVTLQCLSTYDVTYMKL